MTQTEQNVPRGLFGRFLHKLWEIFFPVHLYELKKLLPMLLIFFCVVCNYTIVRDTKDSLVVPQMGAEAIPFLKVGGVLSAATLFMILYAKLTTTFSKKTVFYSVIIPFLIFFGAFAFVLYPLRHYVQPTTSADALANFLPDVPGFKAIVAIYSNWTYALFYILAELWGSAVLSLMFWAFANDIMKVSEAKRFYTILGFGANISLIFAGGMIKRFSQIRANLPPEVDAWGMSLNYMMTAFVIVGVVLLATYWWINRYVLTDTRFYNPEEVKKKKKKAKMTMGESFKLLFSSKYLGCIAILVIGYGISINLVEVTWKNQVKEQYPNPNDYSAFMGGFSQFTGIATMTMFAAGGWIIRRFGWGKAALFTPIVLLVTGFAFFSFIIFDSALAAVSVIFSTTPLMLSVIFGAAQNIASKATKYSLFDPTKEMSYIPLDENSRFRGKAAIDVVGARLGKSGGSLIQAILLMVLPITSMTPYIAVILFGIIAAWVVAVRSLSKQFADLQERRDREEKEAAATKTAS